MPGGFPCSPAFQSSWWLCPATSSETGCGTGWTRPFARSTSVVGMPSRRRTEHTGCTGTPRRRKELPPLLTQDPLAQEVLARCTARTTPRQPGRKPGAWRTKGNCLSSSFAVYSGWSGGFRRRCFASCGGNRRIGPLSSVGAKKTFRNDLRQKSGWAARPCTHCQ